MAKGRLPKGDASFKAGPGVQAIETQAEPPLDPARVSKAFFDADWKPCDEAVAVYGRAFVRNEQGHVVEWQTVMLTPPRASALSSDEGRKK